MSTMHLFPQRDPLSALLTACANEHRLDEALTVRPAGAEETRSDCCVARPVYRVVLPRTGTPVKRAEFLFCRHHFHQARSRLIADQALVFDHAGRLIFSPLLAEILN